MYFRYIQIALWHLHMVNDGRIGGSQDTGIDYISHVSDRADDNQTWRRSKATCCFELLLIISFCLKSSHLLLLPFSFFKRWHSDVSGNFSEHV